MELITVITTLCIGLSILLTPCDSHQILQLQPSNDQAPGAQHSVSALPRKLKVLTEELNVKGHGDRDSTSYYKPKGSDFSGKPYYHHKEASMVHVKGGTWREWVEGTDDTSDFFTMDYTHLKRRRRPIHNKSLPVAP